MSAETVALRFSAIIAHESGDIAVLHTVGSIGVFTLRSLAGKRQDRKVVSKPKPMGCKSVKVHDLNFCDQTAVELKGENQFAATVLTDWNEWIPNGGYLAALMIRAALATFPAMRLVDFHTDFVRPARNSEAEICVEPGPDSTLGRWLQVQLFQQGKLRSTATAWLAPEADSDSEGIERPPNALSPRKPLEDLQSIRERSGGDDPFKFTGNIDIFDLDIVEDWPNRTGLPATVEQYVQWRRPTCTSGCSCLYGRPAILADLLPFFAIQRASTNFERRFITPTASLSLRYPGRARMPRTLFCRAEVDWSSRGFMTSRTRIGDADGQLLTVGDQSAILHPRARAPRS